VGPLTVLLGGSAGRLGLLLLAVSVAVAVAGPLLSPYAPTRIGAGPPVMGPSPAHWLGTDSLGRDVLSRFLSGGRSLVALPVVAVLISGSVGGVLGLWSGYRGGLADQVVARLADVALTLPPLLLGMLFVLGLGSSPIVLVAIVVIFFVPRIFRVVRGATQTVVAQEYVLAAQARGESTASILLRELLPNITGTLLAELAIRLNYAIVLIATLNFLGLGVQPPSPDWGLMVSENRGFIAQTPLATLVPAFGIALLAVGVNLAADQISAHLARNVTYGSRL
jgi:peptide/nickel transport system permease protein